MSQPNLPAQNQPAPKQTTKITARDLVARHKSPAVQAIYDRALKHAYEDQEKLLQKAAKIPD